MHRRSIYAKDHRFAVPPPDSHSDLGVLRQVDLATACRNEPLGKNLVEALRSRPVIYVGRRCVDRQLEIYIDRMAMSGPDLAISDRKSLLVIVPDDLLEALSGHPSA